MKNKKAMYIINKDYTILYLNESFKEQYPHVKEGDCCYRVLGRIDHPCKRCPRFTAKNESTFYNRISKEWVSTECCDMEYNNIPNCTCHTFIKWEDQKYQDTLKESKLNKLINKLNDDNPKQGIVACYYVDSLPIFYANNRFIEILGYESYNDLIKATDGKLKNIMSDSDIARSNQYTKDLIREGIIYSSIYDVKNSHGEYVKTFVKGQIVMDDDGNSIVLSQIADLSDSLSTQVFLENEKRNAMEQDQLIKYIDEVFPGGYFRCKFDKDFSLIEISQRFLDITGLTKEEIITSYESKFINLIHPEDLNEIVYKAEKLFQLDKIISFTYRIRHKTKGWIWVNNTTRCCELNDERYFQSAILDVTDEVEKKFELEKQNFQLNLILGNIPGGFNISYNDGFNYDYVYISNECAALFGYTVEELLSLTNGKAKNICIKEDADVANIVKDSLAKSGDYKVRYRIKCKDGSLKTVIDYGKGALDKYGKPILYSFLLDITEEEENKELIELQNKLLERERERAFEREKSMQQMELIQALSQDFSTVMALNIDTMETNLIYSEDPLHTQEEIKEYYKYHLYDEATEAYIRDFVYADDKESFTNEISIDGIRRNMSDKEIYIFNYRKRVNDIVSYYQLKIVRLQSFASSNVIMGYKNVDDQTRKMLNQKQILSDALAEAQYANRAKTSFLSNMSHDIRTPMNAIIGFTNIAASNLSNIDKVSDCLKKINQSSTHLLSLINDVLDMSRIESGKIKIENRPERISEIIHNVKNIIQANIASRDLNLIIESENVIYEYVYCDKLRINQILINLLSNSMKFTNPGGSVSLKIIQRELLDNNRVRYEFIVSDTGIGMSKEFLEHIFEPFVREKSSTVSGIVGTGLGMSITKSIVDILNGEINVESELGRGTKFTISLDFELQENQHIKENLEEYKDRRALVIDYDKDNAIYLTNKLYHLGMKPDYVTTSIEGLERATAFNDRNDGYLLYIINQAMPKINGERLAEMIKDGTKGAKSIVILLSNDYLAMNDDKYVDYTMEKPLFISDLKEALLRAISKSSGERNEKPTIKESFKGRRLLLAEDNEFNQEIASEILSSVGFIVEVASNGRIALDMLKEHPANYFDAVLMDIQMPVMDGYEATANIRALGHKELSSIPIIAMTANAFSEDRQRALDSGMNGFIPKPISVEKLIAVLKNILK